MAIHQRTAGPSRAFLATLAGLLALLLSVSLPSQAAQTIFTPAVLAAKGIEMKMFALVAFSADGSVLVAMERTRDARMRQQGCSHQIRAFRFAGGRLSRLDTIPVPIAGLQQMAVSDDGKLALAVGEGGSKFVLVDLLAQKARVIWQHRRGVAGFRSEMVIWWHDGAFFLTGYLHDEQDRETFNGIVRLNSARSGQAMFEPVLDLRSVRRQGGPILFEMLIDESQAFFGVVQPSRLIDICEYRRGAFRKLDTVRAVGGIASCPHRVMYAARFENGIADVILRDTATNRAWHLGRDNQPFSYLFLARNGRTVILTLIDFRAKTMSYFYAQESDGFKVRPIKGLQAIRPGTLRLSPDGRVYAFYGTDGLIFGTLP